MSLYDADAEYRVGKMYFDAGKWDLGFPFILKSADMGCRDAIKMIIDRCDYDIQTDDKCIQYLKDYKKQFEKNIKNNPSACEVSKYYYCAMTDKNFEVKINFILASLKAAQYYYNSQCYYSAIDYLQKCIDSPHFELLSKTKKGDVYNDMSLCGWYTNDGERFKTYNKLAIDHGIQIAFNNRANAFFQGKFLCSEPNYELALLWYEKAKKGVSGECQYDYILEQIKKCEQKWQNVNQ